MVDLTFVTAVAPYHDDILQRAIASVQAQTVACEHIVVYDTQKVGAGWARNIGLAEVNTPFVAFLDADDWIEPTFTEKCLQAFDGKRYVYVDWMQEDTVHHAPNCAWRNRTFHCITSLVPTAWIREIEGFDPTLPGAEDTGLFMALMASGHCGKRLAEPLFHYGKEGQRGKSFVNNPAQDTIMRRFTELYGARIMACGDCGDSPNIDMPPLGDPQPGDELALATWAGNRQERGRITGRIYPRASNGKQVYVSPLDIDASPHLWRRVVSYPDVRPAQPAFNGRIPAEANVRILTPSPPNTFPETPFAPAILYGVQAVGAAMNDFQRANFPAPPPLVVAPAKVTPDVAKAIALYETANG